MKTISIQEGSHRAGFHLRFPCVGHTILRRKVQFLPESRYVFATADDADINKLFGASWNGHHHKNSVRWGWNMSGLFAYYYVNGERGSELLIPYVEEEIFDIELILWKDEAHYFQVKKGQPYLLNVVKFDKPFCFGYQLGHYFGGNCPAPDLIQYNFE